MSDQIELQKIVGQIASAYFNNSHVSPSEIAVVISNIAASIAAVGAPAAEITVEEAPVAASEQPKLTPAQVRKSIAHDKLISFEDGKGYKTLRRHLAVKGLTPDEYRTKWGLPKDYPMVSPSYSEARSTLAKAAGFGSRSARSEPVVQTRTAAASAAPAPAVAAAAAETPASVASKRTPKARAAARPAGRGAKAKPKSSSRPAS